MSPMGESPLLESRLWGEGGPGHLVLSLFRTATALAPWAIFDARWSVSSGGEGLNGEVGSEQHLGTMSSRRHGRWTLSEVHMVTCLYYVISSSCT